MSKTIAFLSISNTEGWFIDDDLVHAPLRELGWQVQNVPWEDNVDWGEYDLVVIRSPWDYQHKLQKFKGVLKEIDDSSAMLCNSLDLVLWNIDKNYLSELEGKGVELVPTIRKDSLRTEDIRQAFETFDTDDIVVKPMIGANADDAYRLSNKRPDAYGELESVFEGRQCMIQPFMKHVIDEGEFSLMYFYGELSHVVLKTVGDGDYRVQEEHGGGVVDVNSPTAALLQAGSRAMSALPETPLYARVDLVRTPDDTFALMELELIEPCLYFRFGGGASSSFFAHSIDGYWTDLDCAS